MNTNGAIVLAGGLSTRMGKDKAGLILGGQSLLERVVQSVLPLSGQIVIMFASKQKIPKLPPSLESRVTVGRDAQSAGGPLQGIADALPLLDEEIDSIFVLSCDLPFLTTEVLEEMLQSLTPLVDGVCAEVNGRVNPLLSIYHRQHVVESVKPSAAGRSCMVLIDNHRITRLSSPGRNPQVFNNINTPEAFEKAKSILLKNN